MRFLLLALSLTLAACSSEDSAPTSTGPNACAAAGFTCLDNFPMKCIGQFEDTPASYKNACGKSVSDNTTDVPCCKKISDPPDTGTVDTGVMDSGASDGSDASDAPAEVATDAPDAG